LQIGEVLRFFSLHKTVTLTGRSIPEHQPAPINVRVAHAVDQVDTRRGPSQILKRSLSG
jgi:hypothetical protein